MCPNSYRRGSLFRDDSGGTDRLVWWVFFFKMSWAILPSPLALGYKLLADSSLSLRFHMQSVSADWWWIWILLVLFLKADEKSKHAAALGINPLVADSCFWQIGNTANRPG